MYRVVVSILYALVLGNAYHIEVEVKQGKLLGTREQTVFDEKLYFAFYGVPYAQRPIGKLRFKDPKSPRKWEHPLDAKTQFHGACAQSHIVHKHGLYGSEDCLFLNIYTPSIQKSGSIARAAIVWFHGYAFTSSFSHIYGPDFFIDNDLIFITATHRIGAFGFLKLNDTDSHANMGLKDIVMALKWIRRNIDKFGGNKNNITVMGSGSAATYLTLLLATERSKLFAKMILQSGAMFASPLFQGDSVIERSKLEKNLKSKGFKSILTAPAKVIIEMSKKIYTRIDLINAQRQLVPFLPILEMESNNSLITKHTAKFLQNVNVKSKPMLIGFNTQESISDIIPILRNPQHLKLFAVRFMFMVPFSGGCKHKHMSQTYSKVAEKIKSYYFKGGISEKSIEDFLRYTSDLIKYPIYHFIQEYLKVNRSRTFFYKFNYNGNLNAVKATSIAGVNIKVRGAASGDEICYLMRCEPIWENYVKVNREQNKDKFFIKQITEFWANFAKFGDPTPNSYKRNVTWPPTTIKDDNVLYLSRAIKLLDSKPERRMYKFWKDIYKQYYEHCSNHDEL